MKAKYFVAITAVVGIVVIEVVAICHNVNGMTLAASIGGITAVGGYTFGRIKSK